jgi:hypothetical protein
VTRTHSRPKKLDNKEKELEDKANKLKIVAADLKAKKQA